MKFKAAKLSEKKIFEIEVNEDNFIDARQALERERNKFIDKLREYKSAGLINSLKRLKNKHMKGELDDISHKRKILKSSIEQINRIFLN